MKTFRLLFWVVVGLIILVPSGVVKALTIGGINVTEVTSGDGLYSDSYETGRYVYRGSDVDNYITFNDELWRIIAIESDGTLKIMRNDVLDETMAFDTEGYRDSRSNGAGGTYCEWQSSGCNIWAATSNMVGTPEEFKTVYNGSGTVLLDSSLNTYLNKNYYNSLTSDAQKYIVSHNYNIGEVELWLYDMNIIMAEEQAYQWNGKIGLITVSDYLLATGDQYNCGTSGSYHDYLDYCYTLNWMYIVDRWWLLNPMTDSNVWYMSFGSFYNVSASTINSVRPVVHLTSDLKLSGSGTEEDPYTIVQTNISDIAGETTDDTSVQVVEVPATFMSTFKAVGLGILLVIISGMTIYIIIHKKKINNLPH